MKMHITRKNPTTSNPQTPVYKSRDIYLVSAAIEAGILFKGIESNGHQGIFLLAEGEKLQAVIADYFNGQLRLDPKRVFENLKSLKSQCYSVTGNVR